MLSSRRSFSVFTFAFLDVMCCGFGAVLLVFLLTRHQVQLEQVPPDLDLGTEVRLLTQEIDAAEARIEELNSQASELDSLTAAAREAARQAELDLAAARATTAPKPLEVTAKDIAELRAALKKLETEKRQLESQLNERSRQIRTFTGEGNRQYLSGIKLGGQRILILLDVSTSMLDEKIVNVIRKRNMDDATKRRSEKWQQALATVDWITARFPPTSQYQIYVFNGDTRPLLAGSDGRWLRAEEVAQLNGMIADLKQRIPDGGSNLARAFQSIGRLAPLPDNIFLVTDGLPTQGLAGARGATVSGNQRLRLFEEAVAQIPRGIPINTILLPMEGDPMAASAFWQVALFTRGSFLTPSYDWP